MDSIEQHIKDTAHLEIKKEIYKFFISNKLISIVFIIAFLCTLSYTVSQNWHELIPGIDKWYNLLSQLSIGYIINFGFYVTQVYIPEEKRKNKISKCIAQRLQTILYTMIEPINNMSDKYLPNSPNDNFTVQQLCEIARKLKLYDKVDCTYLSFTGNYYNFKQVIFNSMKKVEEEKGKIFLYYSQYISDELTELLDRITNSQFFVIMTSCCKDSLETSFESLATDISDNNFFIAYYNIYKDLEKTIEIYSNK